MALCFVLSASAQRTSIGERHLSIIGNWTISSAGAELMGGQYTMYGQWFAAVDFLNRAEIDAMSKEKLYFPHFQFCGGYLYRLYGNKTRSFNIYAGADGFIGVEMFDLFRTLSKSTRNAFALNGFKDAKFIFGAAPRIEMEYFFSRSVGATVRLRLPVCFLSKFNMVAFEAGAGIKVNF